MRRSFALLLLLFFCGLGCIFKYEYPKFIEGKEIIITQIVIGVVETVWGDPARPSATFDVRFCPPKGSHPQSALRPDTLYQDIHASMGFK